MSEKQKWWQQAENIDITHTGSKVGSLFLACHRAGILRSVGAVATLKVCSSPLQKKAYELMGRHEEQVLINRRDVMEKKVRRGGR